MEVKSENQGLKYASTSLSYRSTIRQPDCIFWRMLKQRSAKSSALRIYSVYDFPDVESTRTKHLSAYKF